MVTLLVQYVDILHLGVIFIPVTPSLCRVLGKGALLLFVSIKVRITGIYKNGNGPVDSPEKGITSDLFASEN